MRKLSGYGPSLIVLFTAAVVLFAGPRAVQQLTYEQTKTQIIQARHNLESTDPPSVLQQLNQAYRDIATVVEPSVVHVSAQYLDRDNRGNERPGISTGSGWIYDEDGHIVTNHHVIQNAQRIDVQLYNGVVREAEVVGTDALTDIAVIKISPGQLHPARLADSGAPVNQGDLVFAFGSPFDFRFSMSSGVVSGKDRSVGVIRDESGRRLGYENFIQVDAAINPGNSGGPLTDFRGNVIGMNTAIATGRRNFDRNSLEEGQFAGIGLAIPMDMIRPAVTQLIKNGVVEKGFMGVNIAEITPDLARRYGFGGGGVVVSSVNPPDGPAGQAGVRVGDILTHVSGKAVASVAQLRSIISSMLPGETAKLTIWRYDEHSAGGASTEVAIPLARLDSVGIGGAAPPGQSRDAIRPLGIAKMATNSPALAQQFGTEYRPGVMILEVVADSRLAHSIGAGSTIVAINDFTIRNIDDLFQRLFASFHSGNLSDQEVLAEIYDTKGRRLLVPLRIE